MHQENKLSATDIDSGRNQLTLGLSDFRSQAS